MVDNIAKERQVKQGQNRNSRYGTQQIRYEGMSPFHATYSQTGSTAWLEKTPGIHTVSCDGKTCYHLTTAVGR